MDNRKLVSEFSKNSLEKVKVITYEWNERRLIDIRVWVLKNLADPGSEIATKKGITLRIESIPDLIQALEKAQEGSELSQDSPQDERSHAGKGKRAEPGHITP